MSDELKKIAEGLEAVLREEAKEFLTSEGDAWERFAKEVSEDYAEQTLKAKTGSDAEKAEAAENLDFIEAAMASRIASSQLDFADKGEKMLEKILRVAKKSLVIALA